MFNNHVGCVSYSERMEQVKEYSANMNAAIKAGNTEHARYLMHLIRNDEDMTANDKNLIYSAAVFAALKTMEEA